MTKILIPLDGSAAGARAIEQVLQRGAAGLELHLLNVQLPGDGNVRSFVSSDELNALLRDIQASGATGDPLSPLAHGALILIGGFMLMLPGFFTDTLGFLLMMPRRCARH